MNFKSLLHQLINSDSKLITYYQFVRFGSNLFLAIIFSRFFFNTQKLSEYETLLLSISSFVFFWNTGFIRLFQSYYSQFDEKTFIHQILSTSFFAGIFTSLIFIFINLSWDFFLILIGIKIFTSIVTNPLEFYGIALKKHQWIFWIINFYFFIFICWSILCYTHLNLEIMVIGWIFLDIIKLSLFLKNLNYEFKILEKNIIYNLLFLSFAALISGSVEYINFWLVKSYYSDIEFIIYRYGAREIPFSALMAYSLSTSLTAQIQNQNLSFQEVKQKITKLLHLTFPISIFLLLISNHLFEWIYGKEISKAAKVFDIFLLLNISRVMLFDVYLLTYQKHRFFIFTACVEIVIVSLVSIWGIYHSWKVENLAFSIFIAYLLEKIILGLKVKTLNIHIFHFFPISWWLFYSFITSGIFLVKRLV